MKTNFKIFSVPLLAAVVCWALIVACGNKNATGGKVQEDSVVAKPKIDTVELVTSLEELYSYVPKYTVIEKCDLSHLGLEKIPMLKQYNIKCLDLSHNDLRSFGRYSLMLPSSLEELDISNSNVGIREDKNKYAGEKFFPGSLIQDLEIEFREKFFPNLKKLNASFNNIGVLKVPEYTVVEDSDFNKCKKHANEVRSTATAVAKVRRDTVKLVKSLDELYELAPNTIIEKCDLSNQGLTDFPVLKPYNILRLDVSGNDFSKQETPYGPNGLFIENVLPESLVELHMSNCKLGKLDKDPDDDFIYGGISFSLVKSKLPNLKVIDLSKNYIARLLINTPADYVDVSRNDLRLLLLRTKTVNYLDLSYNWNLYINMSKSPGSIKTLKTDSCARGKRLEERGMIML